MYSSLVKWIGSNTCNLAGSVCADGQSLNMGLVVLGLLALGAAVTVIARRRHERREGYYV